MQRSFIFLFMIIVGYSTSQPVNGIGSGTNWNKIAQDELMNALNRKYNTNKARNIILFIGDGMGLSTVTAARILKGQRKGRPGEEGLLSFESFPNVGLAKTYTNDKQVGDSGATATAFLCGIKTNFATLGLDDTAIFGNCSSQKGAEVSSIYDWFNDAGRSVGIVTTSRITHATPAAGYSHTANREWEGDANMFGVEGAQDCTDIAHQLVYNNSHIRVLFGGGRRTFLRANDIDPEIGHASYYSQRRDINLIAEWKLDKDKKGMRAEYVWNNQQFETLDPNSTDFVLGLFNSGHLDYEADRSRGPLGDPSLSNMTKKAIEILQKNNEGFFLLVEGARIDHAHHENNAHRSLLEALQLDEAVMEAMSLTSEEDTLIIVTADHSHVFNIAGYPKRGNNIFGAVDPIKPEELPHDGIPWTTLVYGNGPGYDWGYRVNISKIDPTQVNFVQAAAVPLMYETHSGEDVPIYARGPMSHLFHGVHEQHYIAHVMAYAACVGRNRGHCAGKQPLTRPETPPNGGRRSTASIHLALFIYFIISCFQYKDLI